MVRKHCTRCGKDTWHNVTAQAAKPQDRGLRCTQCGDPPRRAKTEVVRAGRYQAVGNRTMMKPDEQKAFGWLNI